MAETFDLRRERLNLGLTTRQLARRCGVSQRVIEYAERGGRPHPGNAKLIADFFGIEAATLRPLEDAA